MITYYNAMKIHFDRLLLSGFRNLSNNYFHGAEPIAFAYKKAFNKPIGSYAIHETRLNVETNPFVKSIITIIGPEDDDRDLPDGIIMCEGEIAHVNIFTTNIYKGIDSSNIKYYTASVYYSMDSIIQCDTFYKPEYIARNNPFMKAIRMLPFYFTYHHIKDCAPLYFKPEDFRTYLEKYLVNGAESIDLLLDYMETRRYSDNIYDIYSTMTVEGQIDDFYLV